MQQIIDEFASLIYLRIPLTEFIARNNIFGTFLVWIISKHGENWFGCLGVSKVALLFWRYILLVQPMITILRLIIEASSSTPDFYDTKTYYKYNASACHNPGSELQQPPQPPPHQAFQLRQHILYCITQQPPVASL